MAETTEPAVPAAARHRRRRLRRHREFWGRIEPWLPDRFRFPVAECGGFRMRLHPDDNFTERHFFRYDRFPEDDSLAFLAARLAGRQAFFLDIGANAGVFSLSMAVVLGSQGRVAAFEPNPVMVKRLRANIRLNNLQTIGVFPVALGSDDGFRMLSFRAGKMPNLGEASLRPHRNQAAQLRVPVRRLVSLLPPNAGDFEFIAIKIDIEGYEDRVLEPFFAEAGKNLWPTLILIEIAHADLWETPLLARLAGLGYAEIARLDQNLVLERPTGV